MSSEGPLFPKKTSEEGQQEAPPIVIERSDDGSLGTGRTRGGALPNFQGKTVGCSSGVFLLLLGIGMIGYLAARVLI